MEKLRAEGGTHKGTILDANRGGFIVQLEAGPKVRDCWEQEAGSWSGVARSSTVLAGQRLRSGFWAWVQQICLVILLGLIGCWTSLSTQVLSLGLQRASCQLVSSCQAHVVEGCSGLPSLTMPYPQASNFGPVLCQALSGRIGAQSQVLSALVANSSEERDTARSVCWPEARAAQGFTPYRMVDPARLRDKNDQLRNIDSIDEGGEEEAAGAPPQGGKPKRRKLVGQPISVKVVQVLLSCSLRVPG